MNVTVGVKTGTNSTPYFNVVMFIKGSKKHSPNSPNIER